MKYFLLTSLFSALACSADLPEQFIKTARNYTKETNSVIPQKLKNGQNGYFIVTTSRIAKASKQLSHFIQQKEKAGFNVKVVTELNYKQSEGQQKADNIRKWLKENYKSHHAVYALLLGSPRPFGNGVPHHLVRRGQVDRSYSIKTDYTYSDLTGILDPNGDKKICDERTDLNHPDGPDGIADIFVGRIPFSDIQKIDNYFKQLIIFENESTDLTNRHNALFISADKSLQEKWNRVKYEFVAPLNGRSFTISDGDDGWFTPPQQPRLNNNNVIDVINRYNFGFIGFPNLAYGSMLPDTLKVEDRDKINVPKRAGIAYIGNCNAADEKYQPNICDLILEKIAVGVFSGTCRLKNNRKKPLPEEFGFYNLAALGWSNGEILGRHNSSIVNNTGRLPNLCYSLTLFGDPSLVTMPTLTPAAPLQQKKIVTAESSIKFNFNDSSAGFKRKTVTHACSGGGCGTKVLFSDLTLKDGKIKSGMKFNGVYNQYGGAVSEKRYPDALRSDYHATFWVKLDEACQNGSIIQKVDSWNIAIVDGKLVFEFYQNTFEKNYIVKTKTEGVHFDQQYWNKIELKIDRTKEEMTGWLNGKMVSKAKIKAKLPSGSESLITIGKNCQGLIDELNINNVLK